jgi:hypothetical protein
MQDRYAGDVGDFVKLGLLRAISPGRRLGVAWYRFPDEGHNGDGRHIGYLDQHLSYEALDPTLFHHLRDVVSRERSIRSLLSVLDATASMDKSLDATGVPAKARREWRKEWFSDVLEQLSGCDIVFADPDNGIIDDQDRRKGSSKFGKQMPLTEVRALASGRCAVVYHHNTRRTGGHDAEVDYWLGEIGLPGFAVRATRYSPRTFFVLNPDEEIEARAKAFCERWSGMKVRMHH